MQNERKIYHLESMLDDPQPPQPNPTNNKPIFIIILLLFLVIVTSSFTTWHYAENQQPITQTMRDDLTALADQAATKTNKTRRKIWGEMKKHLNVRRIGDIQKGDLEEAEKYLRQKAE